MGWRENLGSARYSGILKYWLKPTKFRIQAISRNAISDCAASIKFNIASALYINLLAIFKLEEFPKRNQIILGGAPFSVARSMKSLSKVTIV